MNELQEHTDNTSVHLASANLPAEFLTLHQQSLTRNTQDISDCTEAQGTDVQTLNLLNLYKNHQADKTQLIAALQSDISQDVRAAGDGTHAGADQQNAKVASRLIGLNDQASKAVAPDDKQEQALLADNSRYLAADRNNDLSDAKTEQLYIQHDRALISALQSGKGVDAAMNAVAADRNADIANETRYITNDRNLVRTNQQILDLFGNFTVVNKEH